MTVRTTVLLLFVSAALPAFAQQPSQLDQELAALKTYCKADIDRLCHDVPPGGGNIKKCLMEHQNEMSVGCAKALQQLQQSKK